MRSKCAQRFLLICSSILILSPPAFSQAIPITSPSPASSRPVLTDASLNAVITYGLGQTLIPGSYRGVTRRVGLDPNQVVTVTLQFPVTRTGEPVAIEPLDGGTILGPAKTHLSRTGALQFQFQANKEPGLTQVRVRLGSDEYGLQFYVFDPRYPEKKPRIPKASPPDPMAATQSSFNGRGH